MGVADRGLGQEDLMMDESRPDDPTTAQGASAQVPTPTQLIREAVTPRRDRWLMPLVVAGCTLAGVAMGFVMGRETVRAPHEASSLATRAGSLDEHSFKIDVDTDDDDGDKFAYNYNFHGPGGLFGVHVMPPVPPMPPMGPRELVVNNCGDDDDDDKCTTIIKRRSDGSVVIVKSKRP
jgi:hypothetical protein